MRFVLEVYVECDEMDDATLEMYVASQIMGGPLECATTCTIICEHLNLSPTPWGSAICTCGELTGKWYCEKSPNNTCEYRGNEWCIHCGEPEERK